MPYRPSIMIGIGGTGKEVLRLLRERLQQEYGGVPQNVELLSFDSADGEPSKSSLLTLVELPRNIELCHDEVFDLLSDNLRTIPTKDRPADPKFRNLDTHRRVVAAAEITESSARADALGKLLPALMDLSEQEFQQLWFDLLDVLARRSRRDLLGDIAVLAPVIAYFGGEEAIQEVTRAIQDVMRWWP